MAFPYGLNDKCGQTNTNNLIKYQQVMRPSSKVWVCETTPSATSYPYSIGYTGSNEPCPNFRHGGIAESVYGATGVSLINRRLPGICNTIFFDGHVEGMNYDYYTSNYKDILALLK